MNLVDVIPQNPKLDRVQALLSELGHPERKLRCVHIAGTNGKGSTAHLIASGLASAGMKVGLYTSPHLLSPTERIKIVTRDGVACIPPDRLTEAANCERQSMASFFEIMTALAFQYFAEQHVDYAVIECGLGGLLDATNVLPPQNVALAVITNIGLDHCQLLGHSIPEIAVQKAGIIKPGVPTIIGESHPLSDPVFTDKGKECGILGEGLETTDCRLWFADRCGYLRHERLKYAARSPFLADYEQMNMQTAFVALRQLGVPNAAIADGFEQVVLRTGLHGRFEVLSHSPLTICDAGHNVSAFESALPQLEELSRGRQLHIVLGMVADKDIDAVLRILPADATYYFTTPDTYRALPAQLLDERWCQLRGDGTLHGAYPAPSDALAAAQHNAQSEDIIYICGSFYLLAAILPFFPNRTT